MTRPPQHRPLKPGARLIWTLITLAAFTYAGAAYIAILMG